MLDYKALLSAITTLPTSQLQGVAYRVIQNKYLQKKIGDLDVLDTTQMLSAIGSRKKGGRYNPPLVFEALYLADELINAFLEIKALKKVDNDRIVSVPGSPRTQLSIKYHLNTVLDLVDRNVQSAIATNLAELKQQDWLDVNQNKYQITPTQQLGLVVYILSEIEALKVPSAITDSAYNLVIFTDRLSKDSFVEVSDNSARMDLRIS
jgi:RES domain-containing protein